MEDVESDARFAHTLTDPRFRPPHIKQRKIKIDSRFKSMLKDKEFTAKVTVDKRGRPISSSTKENLERLYDYESDEEKDSDKENDSDEENDEEEDDSDDVEREEEEKNEGSVQPDSEEDEASDSSEEEEEEIPQITEDGPDYARGGGTLESSDDDDDDDDDDDNEVGEDGILDHHWNEPELDAPEAGETTRRLALCNMDWDRIKASDLHVLFSSFVPQGGALRAVTIYLSQTGQEKLEEEAKLGPREFREGEKEEEGGGNRGKTGGLNRAKLRQYQLNRLKYYFAVIDFDSKETASAVYEECDAMEYEKSSCRVDLRFIPDEMMFDETVKEACTGLSDLASFEPSTFTSTALCQAKVEVTWDETSIDRLKKTMKIFTEEDLDKEQFDDLVASSEEESGDDDKDSKKGKKKGKKSQKKKVKNYRKLLGLEGGKKSKKKKKLSTLPVIGSDDEDDEDDETEEVQLASEKEKKKNKGNKNAGEEISVKEPSEDEDEEREGEEGDMQFTWEPAANLSALTKKGKEKLTPWEDYQRKKREKKKGKRKEKKKDKLKSQGVEDTAELGFDDPFFNDNSDDEGKKKKKKKEGRRKRKQREESCVEEESEETRKEKAALGLLMKDDDEHLNHFSLEKIMDEEKAARKKKGKKRKQAETVNADTFEIKVDESRFGDLYTNPEMHIDPTAPEFKKTKSMTTLIGEISKRRKKTS